MEHTISIGERTLAIRPNRDTYRALLSKVGSLQRVLTYGAKTEADLDEMLDVVSLSLSTGDQVVSRDWLKVNLSALALNRALEEIGLAYRAAAAAWLRPGVA